MRTEHRNGYPWVAIEPHLKNTASNGNPVEVNSFLLLNMYENICSIGEQTIATVYKQTCC